MITGDKHIAAVPLCLCSLAQLQVLWGSCSVLVALLSAALQLLRCGVTGMSLSRGPPGKGEGVCTREALEDRWTHGNR